MPVNTIDVTGLTEPDIQRVRELIADLRTKPVVPSPAPPVLRVRPGAVIGSLTRTEIYDDAD